MTAGRRPWQLHPEPDNANALARETRLHPALAAVLSRRGHSDGGRAAAFLNPALSGLEDPFAFPDMKKAADRLKEAIARHEKILVYGDYDVDGVTGCAVLVPALKKLGADVEPYIPHRLKEGYGLNKPALERLLARGFRVMVTVDNGITAVDAVEFATRSGVDVIIVDHHKPKGRAPECFATICAFATPKDADESVRSGGFAGQKRGDPNLAACGLAFKLVWALTGRLEDALPALDIVTLGTIGDVAPVLGDNRILLKHGLEALAKTRRPGIRALMRVARITPASTNYRDVAFGLAPRINASGRMGSSESAYRILVTEDTAEAERLAIELDGGNRDRQRVEAETYEEALARVEGSPMGTDERILVIDGSDWHEGVLGIVASRLVERYQKPSIVISTREGVGKGSGRSIPLFSLFDCVLRCEDLLESFGGHPQACGLTIREENVSLFRQRLNRVAAETGALKEAPPLEIDAELPPGELDLKFLNDLDRLSPFGPGNRKPLFLSRGMKLKAPPKKRGKDTLQCWMSDSTGKMTCEVVGFRHYERWKNGPRAESYDVVYQPARIEFGGIQSIQLELEDWRPAEKSV